MHLTKPVTHGSDRVWRMITTAELKGRGPLDMRLVFAFSGAIYERFPRHLDTH